MLMNIGSSGVWPRGWRALVTALLYSLTCAPLHAQDWMSGVSPWSSFASPMTPSTTSPWSTFGSPMNQSTLSPWSSFGSPMSPSTLSPWSGFGSQMNQSTLQSLPYSYGSQFGNQWPAQSSFSTPYQQQPFNAWQTPYAVSPSACIGTTASDTHQPDLTGFWRGSGGESVEVQRNYARIWGGQDKPCNCIFFLVGQRLIAYSPDSDVVRKYWYQSGGNNQFTLIDESGNRMTYQRVQ